MARVLIYSSARKLLAAGRTGFGTVARSRKISTLAVGAIERLSQFDSKRGSDRSRVILAYRRINVGNTSIHLLSSIRDAGADYTGRTNHLAHHVLVDASEARRLAGKGITPADVLQNYTWLQTWDGAPRYFEDNEDVDLLALNTSRQTGTREQWERLTGNGIHARLIASKQAPKSAVLVLPDNEAPLPLMAEALTELDGHSWDVTFTTALEPSDSVGDFAWVITPAKDSPTVLDRCSSRAILRADHPDQLPMPEERPIKKPTLATKTVAHGVTPDARPVGREPDVAVKNQPAGHGVLSSPPVSHHTRHAGAVQRPKSRNQGVPLAAIIGVSAALLIAGVMLWLKDKRGQTDLAADQKTEQTQLSPEQKKLAVKLASTGTMSRNEADKGVSKFKDEDCTWWLAYLENLKKVCDSENPWSELEKGEMLKGKARMPDGIQSVELQWMQYMIKSKDRNVFNDLVKWAKKFKGKPLPQKHWEDFDKIATNYTGKKPFKENQLDNPFRNMATELLKRQVDIGFVTKGKWDDKKVKDLRQILESGIWQNSSYEDIPHNVFWDLTKNAKNVSEWESFVRGYKELRDLVIGEDMKSYLALHKEYEKINDEWSAKGTEGGGAEKKNTGYKNLLDKLTNKHQSKPKCLSDSLKTKIGDSSVIAKKDDSVPKNPQPKTTKEAQVTKRFLVKLQDLKGGRFKTDLLSALAKAPSGSDSGWTITIDGEKASLEDKDTLKKTTANYLHNSGVKVANDGTSTLNANAEVFKELVIQYGSKKEHIFILGHIIEGDNDRPLWGEPSFDLKREGLNLVLTGDLRDRLNELDKSYKKVEWRNKNEIDGKFKRSNDSWIWKGFFDVRGIEPLKLKIDEKQKDTPPRNELIRLREECEVICKRPLTSAKLGSDRDDLKKKKRDSVKALHGYIEKKITRAELKKELVAYKKAGPHFDDLERLAKSSKLIGFTKYLEKRSDPNEAKSRKEKSAEDKKKKMKQMIEIKVYSPGTNDKNRRLIFKGKRK